MAREGIRPNILRRHHAPGREETMSSKSSLAKASLLATILLADPAALANDTSFGDSNGTIVFKGQPDISMDKEVLAIGRNNIQVDYVFTNNSASDLVVPIAFPMPPMYFGESDHEEMTDFKLWVDGRPVETQRRLVILLDGKTDITGQMQAFGWNEEKLIRYLDGNPSQDEDSSFPEQWFDANGPRFTLNEYFT